MPKLTLNIVYSVTLSVYQHRAEIELTTFGMLAQCSANRATGSNRFEHESFHFLRYRHNLICGHNLNVVYLLR